MAGRELELTAGLARILFGRIRPMTSLTEKPPARTGKCSLILSIDGRRYRVSPAPPISRGSKIWRLKVEPGQTRAGLIYSVCSFSGQLDCTCPDASTNLARCKHMQALAALGLVSRAGKSAGERAWENLHPRPAKPARKPRKNSRAKTPKRDDLAAARRRHKPVTAAPFTAAAWNSAVATHVAQLAAGGAQ
jgi:hypothetical protein